MQLTLLQAIVVTAAQILVMLATAPGIVGLIRKVKARFQCRCGARLFQPYADLAKLFRKQPVVSSTTSWIFTATPYIVFASTMAAGLLVPVFASQVPLNFAGNIIALVAKFSEKAIKSCRPKIITIKKSSMAILVLCVGFMPKITASK